MISPIPGSVIAGVSFRRAYREYNITQLQGQTPARDILKPNCNPTGAWFCGPSRFIGALTHNLNTSPELDAHWAKYRQYSAQRGCPAGTSESHHHPIQPAEQTTHHTLASIVSLEGAIVGDGAGKYYFPAPCGKIVSSRTISPASETQVRPGEKVFSRTV